MSLTKIATGPMRQESAVDVAVGREKGLALAPLFLRAHDVEANPQQDAEIGGHDGLIDRLERIHEAES